MGRNYIETNFQQQFCLDIGPNLPPDAGLSFFPQVLDKADYFFNTLMEKVQFKQNLIQMYGKVHPVPRLEAWFAHRPYTYSGVAQEPQPWPTELLDLLSFANRIGKVNFNSALLNLYRHGQDWVSYHQDDEELFGDSPTILSLSLGETRNFSFRRLSDKTERYRLALGHGDALLMKGVFQKEWQHQLDKSSKSIGPRLNITFRAIL